MATLKEFLVDVATDPQKLKTFKNDPQGVIKSAGLSQEDLQALQSGDPQAIKARVGPVPAADAIIILIL